jgi:magnesium-transporting ATPase (P-type)
MVTAVTLALALAFEPGEPAVMDQPPRPAQEALLTRPLLTRIVFVSLLMLVVTVAAFEWELQQGSSLETARTAAVTVLVAAEIAYLFQARHYTKTALATETFSGNRAALVVTGLLIVLQLLFVYFGPMQSVFDTTPLSTASWLTILALAAVVFVAVEVEKAVWRWRGVRRF